jgi:hypothetical protein
MSFMQALRSLRRRLIWCRAVRMLATSMSDRGNPCGSTRGVAIVTSFCNVQQASVGS